MPWLDTGVESGNVGVDVLNTFDIRMPQVVKKESWIRLLCILRDFLKSWLDCPRLTELWKICWNLDWTAPGVLDSDMSCPLLIGDLSLEESSFWSDFTHWESFRSSEHSLYEFLRCQTKRSNADSDIRIMQSLCLSRSFEKCIFSRKLFIRQINTRFRAKPYRSQDTFCNSMLSN